ncbi:MAG: protein kinase [Chloroflexi bacterium]|nr:protein kinase [Chloroflexota bacterium]
MSSQRPIIHGRIGDYELLNVIGRGGMGIVYESFDWRRHSKVAVKTLSQEMQLVYGAEDLFRASIELQMRLQHPNIVRVFGVWSTLGFPYAVFEYCSSATKTWQNLQERIDTFKDICAAIQYTHERGIVHGDIKPSNILIAVDGRGVITDFVDTDFLLRQMTSQRISIRDWGTALYMSPQRLLEGSPSISDDIYALGASLLELVGGTIPYSEEGKALAQAKLKNQFEIPNQYHLTGIDRVIRQAMSGDEHRRYQSVSEIITELESVLIADISLSLLHWEMSETLRRPARLIDKKGTEFPIVGKKTTIGRHSKNDIVIDDPMVSRFHAVILNHDGYFVQDTGTLNGTCINGGIRVSVLRRLELGDELQLGSQVLRLQFEVYTSSDTEPVPVNLPPYIIYLVDTEEQLNVGIPEGLSQIVLDQTGAIEMWMHRQLLTSVQLLVEIAVDANSVNVRAVAQTENLLLNGQKFIEGDLTEGDSLCINGRNYIVQSALPKWIKKAEETLFERGRISACTLGSIIPASGHSKVVEECYKRHTDLDLVLDLQDQALEFRQISLFSQFRRLWQDSRQFLFNEMGFKLVAEMVSFIARVLDLTTLEPERASVSRFLVYSLDISPITANPQLGPMLPIVIFVSRQFTRDDILPLQTSIAHLEGRGFAPLILISLLSEQGVARDILDIIKTVYAINVFPATFMDLIAILFAKNPISALRETVLSHTDLEDIIPFIITGPTSKEMFFGRESDLERVRKQAVYSSFAIIGGRRIGKSSFLLHLHRIRLSAAGIYTIYHDCSTTPTYEDFLSANIRDWQPEAPVDAPATFADFLHSPRFDRSTVLLLDEADKLVPADRASDWPLFNALRALSNSGYAQLILSGERALRNALRDPKSPLFNFANVMLLGPLDYPAVEDLITQPMRQLAVELVDEKAIINSIWEFTSGHPNVVQRLCCRLIQRFGNQGTRSITLDDVNAVIENPSFQRDDFLSTYWEAATPLERIISLLIADDESVRTLRTVRQVLAEHCDLRPKAREVDDALQRLVDLRSILKHTPTGYEFAVKAFPQVVAGTMTLDDMLEILTEEYQEQSE